NAPRPVIAGGTGANNVRDARINLGAEAAAIKVTNYDSHVFESGSFYSQPGATSEPVGSNVSGSAVIINSDPNYITLAARDNATGLSYVRHKTAGVWSAWFLDGSDKLSSTGGGTVNGPVTINSTLNVTGTTTLATLNAGTTSVGALTAASLNTGPIVSTTINTQGNT